MITEEGEVYSTFIGAILSFFFNLYINIKFLKNADKIGIESHMIN